MALPLELSFRWRRELSVFMSLLIRESYVSYLNCHRFEALRSHPYSCVVKVVR